MVNKYHTYVSVLHKLRKIQSLQNSDGTSTFTSRMSTLRKLYDSIRTLMHYSHII